LHMTELQAWRTNRNTIRTIVYVCLSILITFTLVNFFHVEVRFRVVFSTFNLNVHSSVNSDFQFLPLSVASCCLFI
jgi:hypothetical protein